MFVFPLGSFLFAQESQRSWSAAEQRLWSWQEFSLTVVRWHIHQVGRLLTWRIDARFSVSRSASYSLRQPAGLFYFARWGHVCLIGGRESHRIKGNRAPFWLKQRLSFHLLRQSDLGLCHDPPCIKHIERGNPADRQWKLYWPLHEQNSQLILIHRYYIKHN